MSPLNTPAIPSSAYNLALLGINLEPVLFPLAYTFVLSAIATWTAIHAAHRFHLIAHPNERSSHAISTPQVGGIAIGFAALAGLFFLPEIAPLRETGLVALTGPFRHALMALLAGGLLLGVLDDLYAISASKKLIGLFIIALLPILYGFPLEAFPSRILLFSGGQANACPGSFGPWTPEILIALAILWIVAFSNAFNFMDGVNGQSAAFALNALGWYALLVFIRPVGTFFPDTLYSSLGQVPPAWLPENLCVFAALAGAILGFLPFNFPRAATFMGDAGSLPLGAALALITLHLSQGSLPQLLGFSLPLAVYIYDVGFTLIRRIRRRENIFKAHREHLYQRMLIATGWSHARLLAFHLPFYLATGAASLVFFYDNHWDNRLCAILLAAAVLAAYTLLVLRAEKTAAGKTAATAQAR